MDWYVFTLIALFGFGIQTFLYKVSAEKKCNTAWTTFSFMATVAIISSALFLIFGESIISFKLLLLISFLNAITFFITTVTRIEALKHLPLSTAIPIVRLNIVFVVLSIWCIYPF